ncbi:hypothetical protein PVA38_10895 [Streptococcus pneumoniae D39]|nr:hypothetical protein PVA38_10895 [Streptococcus pneumoniae D39]
MIDTPFVTVSVDDNITVYDKTTHEAYEDFIRFEDRGDCLLYTSDAADEARSVDLGGRRIIKKKKKKNKSSIRNNMKRKNNA